MFYGRGAGKIPTAGAVLADIAEIAKHMSCGQIPPVLWKRDDGEGLYDSKLEITRFYCRVKGDKIPENASVVSRKDGQSSFVTPVMDEYQLDEMLKNFEIVSEIRFMK